MLYNYHKYNYYTYYSIILILDHSLALRYSLLLCLKQHSRTRFVSQLTTNHFNFSVIGFRSVEVKVKVDFVISLGTTFQKEFQTFIKILCLGHEGKNIKLKQKKAKIITRAGNRACDFSHRNLAPYV